MSEPAIDPVIFAELQESAGADFVRELVQTFLEEAPTMLEALQAALAAGDGEAFRRHAHSLKSNALTFGALALADEARALELGGLPAAPAPAQTLDALGAQWARAATALQERLRHD